MKEEKVSIEVGNMKIYLINQGHNTLPVLVVILAFFLLLARIKAKRKI